MAPNTVDGPLSNQDNRDTAPKLSSEPISEYDERVEAGPVERNRPQPNNSKKRYILRTFLTSLNLLAHILVGAVTAISYLYGFRNGLPLGATPLHIVLCVTGYQLLMAEGILSLTEDSGWSSHLTLVHKRRAHFSLLLLGSGLAIVGSFVKILDKENHWNTLHGQFALVALVFTSVSLVNGLASLYAYEWRKVLPGNVSKLSHICFGTVAFGAACISLCYGFEKAGFRVWLGDAIAYTAISFTATLTFIILVAPAVTFFNKSKGLLKR